MSTIAAVIGRIFIAALFIVSGAIKLLAPAIAAQTFVAAGFSQALVVPVALFEIVAGACIAIGLMTRLAALLLTSYTVLTIVFVHNQFSDPAQTTTILMHVALVGGLLLVFAHSQIWWSYDHMRRRRAEERAAREADERRHDAELRAARAEGRSEAVARAPVAAAETIPVGGAVPIEDVPVRTRRWYEFW